MSENNEASTSTGLKLITNHDLSESDLLSYKRRNSTHRRSASVPPVLNSQDDSDFATVSHYNDSQLNPRNSLSGNSQTSTKIETNNDDRFGDHNSDNDDDNSRDYGSNSEEHDSISEKEHDPHNCKDNDGSQRTPLQRKSYYFFEEPVSNWAKAFEVFSTLCTIATIVAICVISWPTIHYHEDQMYYSYWIPLDIVSLITFTIQYIGRFYASVNKWKFFFKPMNLIDLISIIPFYAQLISQTESMLKFVRVLRLFRIIRLFDVAKHSVGFSITAKVFQRSAYQIVMVLVYVFIIVLASSALMFYIERGSFNQNDMTWYRVGKDGKLEVSPFQSIIHSFWWSIVTLTTTGYGDAVPITGLGKLVAALTMTCGILVIALPTSIIGSNFSYELAIHRIHARTKLQKHEATLGFTNKSKRIQSLQKQNKSMLEALAVIQDKLADINPPNYYKKYKKLEENHLEALKKITELESRLEKWKRVARNLDTFNNKFRKRAHSDSDSDDIDNSFEKDNNKTDGWRFLPFRNFRSSSQRNIMRFGSDVDANYKKKRKLLSPFRTLSKIGKSLNTSKSTKLVPEFTKELISSPTELRLSFTPIVDSTRDNNTKSVNNNDPFSRYVPRIESDVELQYILANEGDAKGKGTDRNNTGKNGDEDFSSDKNRNNKQNFEAGGIEVVVDKAE